MEKVTSEIAKLTERIAKDPQSKLFVPLAEEYKKTGDIEAAIHVLSEGIEKNPGYISARAFLGKLLLTKGDIAGSRREFEEVVKAIPDNLMAQKKLGDICVLEGHPQEALIQYKIVLQLSPSDEEVIGLVNDIQAGIDVRSRITDYRPVAEPGPEMPPPSGQPARAAAEPKAGQAPGPPEPSHAEPMPVPAAGMPSSEVAAAPPPAEEAEEPEEILDVAPLENGGIAEAGIPGAETSEIAEAGWPEGVTLESPQAGPGFADQEAFAEPEAGFGVEGGEEPSAQAAPQATAPAPAGEAADDFTTDTLAELYIAQGFYEKAIDIYERMLADRPTSIGLQQKLQRVREMAEAAPEAPSGAAAPPESFELPPEQPLEIETSLPEAQEYRPPEAPEVVPEETGEEAFDMFAPPGTPRTVSTDYEPREYVPPAAATGGEGSVPASGGAGNRQAAISRLETWLKKIQEEK